MKRRHVIAGALATVAVAAGTAGAIAASSGPGEAERAVLADAAERLDVTPEELRSALAAAEDAQLDAEVKAGRLTREQADAIKERRKASGTVLGFGHGGPHHGGPGGPGGHFGPGMGLFEDAAKALGISVEHLFEQLRDGKTLAQIAKAAGKSADDVRAAVKAAATKRLDAAMDAGRITKAQRDELLEHLDEHIDRFGERPAFRGRHHFRGGPGRPPPPPLP